MTLPDPALALARRHLCALLDDLDADPALALVIDGTPEIKGRPRWTGTHMITPVRTRVHETALVVAFTNAWHRPALVGAVALVLGFYLPNLRRKDADNLEKLVMDAATRAGIWADDSQVTAKLTVVGLDRARPRTVILIAPWGGLTSISA